jgi:hypothetical protein
MAPRGGLRNMKKVALLKKEDMNCIIGNFAELFPL